MTATLTRQISVKPIFSMIDFDLFLFAFIDLLFCFHNRSKGELS